MLRRSFVSELVLHHRSPAQQTIHKQKGSAETVARVLAGASGEITDAFALFALSLLGGNALRELNESCAKNETKVLSQVLQSQAPNGSYLTQSAMSVSYFL